MAWRSYPPVTSLILSSTSLDKLDTELKELKKEINTLDTTSRTALHYCILQEAGAVNATGFEYETIIDEKNSGDCRMARAMAEVQWLNLKNPTMSEMGKWPKRLAYAYLICKNGADVNLKDKGGWPILRACVQRGDLLLIQMLIHFGADTSCSSLSELAYDKGNFLCAVYIDKHSLSLRTQCRGSMRLHGYDQNAISKLRLPSPIKLFLNYYVLYPGYIKKLVPICTFTDVEIMTGEVTYNDVMLFVNTYATQEFCHSMKINQSAVTLKQDLVMVIRKLYNEDCFNELSYEEPPLRKPRYSMEQVPIERMKMLGLYREKKPKEDPPKSESWRRYVLK